MTPKDFRRFALELDGAEEGAHLGAVDFRVGGRIFATLAHQAQGYGNLMLSPEQQASFVEEVPDGERGSFARCASHGMAAARGREREVEVEPRSKKREVN